MLKIYVYVAAYFCAVETSHYIVNTEIQFSCVIKNGLDLDKALIVV